MTKLQRHPQLLTTTAVVASMVLIAVLTYQNRSLKSDLAHFLLSTVQAHEGMVVPGFLATTLSGDSVTIGGLDAGMQILFFFNTSCPYCRASIDGWNRVAQAVEDSDSVKVFGVVLDSARAAQKYALDHELQFPVAVIPERRLAQLYRINRIPLTLVVDGAGRVAFAKAGELVEETAIDSIISLANRFADMVR